MMSVCNMWIIQWSCHGKYGTKFDMKLIQEPIILASNFGIHGLYDQLGWETGFK